MATLKQYEANGRNSSRSTGPLTVAGKAVVGKNAVTHGLSAVGSLVPGDDRDEYDRFQAGIYAEFSPCGELELAMVDRIVTLFWKLKRMSKIESGVLSWRYQEVLRKRAAEKVRAHTKVQASPDFEAFNFFKALESKIEVVDET